METQYFEEPPPPDVPQYAELLVALIEPSKTNPRKRIDDAMIDELAASVAKVGVLQPILIREHPENPIKFEIVAGECRWRAAQKAGLQYIPATIRTLTDLEALELQVLENLHRNDLHPLEEAEGFQQLLDANGYTVEALAEKVGKSKAAIYASLKLCALCPAGREAFFEGKLSASTALLVARIPGATLQAKAVKEVTKPNYNGDIPSYREAARIIRQNYMLDLVRAIFDQADPTLRPGAGDCYSCEKRSGNCREIFPDIDSADVCTDPDCFKTKRDAHIELVKQDPNTITGEEAERMMPGPYWLKDKEYELANDSAGLAGREDDTWEDLLGSELPVKTLLVEGRDPVRIVNVAEATQIGLAKGLEFPAEEKRELTKEQIESEKRASARNEEVERRIALMSALHDRLSDPIALEHAHPIAASVLIKGIIEGLGYDDKARLLKTRGETPETFDLGNYADTGHAISVLLVEIAALRAPRGNLFWPRWDWTPDNQDDLSDFYAILRAAGIDPEQPLETPPSPTSAAHAEINIAREENPEPAAQAGEPVAQPEETHIEAAVPAAPRKRGRPRKQAVLTPAAEVVE